MTLTVMISAKSAAELRFILNNLRIVPLQINLEFMAKWATKVKRGEEICQGEKIR